MRCSQFFNRMAGTVRRNRSRIGGW